MMLRWRVRGRRRGVPLPEVKIFIDGGARGNPGPSGYGVYVVASDGTHLGSYFGYLGVQTNNVAEYHALLAALEHAGHSGWQRLWIGSDSELLVKQFRGEYRVKNPALRELYARATRLASQLSEFTIQHIPRSRNGVADGLANKAMDLKKSGLVEE